MEYKKCNHCGELKTKDCFLRSKRHSRFCSSCVKEKNRLCHKINNKRKQSLLRERVIIALGGKCVWCGYGNPIALQLDHVDGGGSKIREKGQNWYRFYKEVIEGSHPHKIQLLCANCNTIKRHKEGEWRLN